MIFSLNMSPIDRKLVASVVCCLTLGLMSWHLRNFALLLSTVLFIFTALSLTFPRFVNAGVSASATCIALIVGEMMIPAIVQNDGLATEYDSETTYASGEYYESIKDFGYRPTPGTHTSRKLTRAGETIYDVSYTIGPDGYRYDVFATDFDAYLFGGSFAFGEGLNDNETLSYFLHKNHGIASKNYGVHGYGLHQALYTLTKNSNTLSSVDFVILLTAPWHSLRSACKPAYTAGTPLYVNTGEELQLDGTCPPRSVLSRILSKSNVFSLVKTIVSADEGAITDSDIDLYVALIKAIKKLSDKHGASLVIGYIDARDTQLSTSGWTNARLIEELQSISTVVDLTLAETRESLSPKFFIHDLDQHPSALANRLRAERLSAFLSAGTVGRIQ